MNQEDIFDILDLGEDQDREFKSAKGGLPGSLWETYSAFANTEGGIIILGIKERSDGSFDIQGLSTEELPKLKKRFWDLINNRGHVSRNLLSDKDLETKAVKGKTILLIHVPMAGRHERPIYLDQNPMTGTYRRNYEGDYHCTEAEVRSMMLDASETPADYRVLEHFSFDDIDLDTLMQYRNRFSARSPNHAWLSEDPEGFFKKLGGWRLDRATGQEGVTVAGLLMFGRHSSITDAAAIPGFHLDYQEQLSDDPNVRWTDRITYDGTWECNIFQFYQRVIPRLTTDLKIPFQLEPELFRKDDTLVHVAIREAVVNALIHADYLGQGGVIIIKKRDQFELSNPGTLLLSIQQIIYGGVSECRNKTLQTMFSLIGAGEKAGSGVDKIRQGWGSQHWRWPWIQIMSTPNRIRWILPMVTLLSEETLDYLHERFGSQFDVLSETGRMALVLAYEEDSVTNSRLQQVSSKHPADISRELQNLVSSGLLVQKRTGRWAEYSLPHKESSLPDKTASLPDKAPSLPHKEKPQARRIKLEDLAAEEVKALQALAAEARASKRMAPAKIREIISALCLKQYLTAEMIAELIGRNVKTIRSHLREMVQNGQLFRKYPHDPTRSNQAYTSDPNKKMD